MTVSQKDHIGRVAQSKPAPLQFPFSERRGPPLAVKAVLILVGINLFVAAMLVLKLRAPHLG